MLCICNHLVSFLESGHILHIQRSTIVGDYCEHSSFHKALIDLFSTTEAITTSNVYIGTLHMLFIVECLLNAVAHLYYVIWPWLSQLIKSYIS